MTNHELPPLERLLAIEECRRLMVEYGRRLDHGRGASAADLFTEDGAWRSPTIDAVGREELRAFFARRDALTDRTTRHVVTNIAVDVLDADHARGVSVAVELRDDQGPDGLAVDTRPAIAGDYEDEFVRVDGRWLFRERRVVVAFKRETEAFMRPLPTAEQQ
ncbi:nuclear transport factor 2 family protein [Streptomyces hirsutus]|uniref:Nuclear transport factor 2 family protein n=1 Tax=Streptomyces hirsutus TaxID=35620 RepID=A0ABZ1GEN0_9ACTN|nr:nuclear transport factor 2 family protein [Streptomyces hirsutus]WSD04554.1 nuclear transport factor 2 family protein [Streptomyces hirsutus]WTD22055.1 nuclear transport factor 2 family protein [Streptomyces hirsutus]WTD79435.1 nuclear transport factor 2 family protein [Streptomyces sp. NBC_01635]